MGLLERIFFRHWPRPLEYGGPPDLALDLANGALGSFHLDSSVEILKERLGPPANWRRWRKYGEWHYPNLGVYFDTEKGLMVGLNLVLRGGDQWIFFPEWGKLWRPWSALLRFPDGFKSPALEVKVGDFLEHAGEPSKRDADDEEIVLTYTESPNFSHVAFDAEFTPEGLLTALFLWSTRG